MKSMMLMVFKLIINKNELLVRISLQEFMQSVAVGYTILSHDKVTQQNHVIKARLMMIRCCSISAYKCPVLFCPYTAAELVVVSCAVETVVMHVCQAVLKC